jgi:hypothetical protein
MLAGRRPFHGIAFPMVLYAIAHEPPTELESIRKDIPRDLLAVVSKAMSKRKEDRYGNMFELLAALEPFADRVSMDASMDDLVASSSAKLTVMPYAELLGLADESRRSSSSGAAPTSSTLPNPNQNPTKKHRSMLTLFGGIAAALILLVGAVGLLWSRSTPSGAPSPASSVAQLKESVVEVDVSVTPINASVEVDGRLVETKKGIVKIKGVVGTVRHVRAFVGTNETHTEVVISLDGAVPSRINVATPVPSSSNAKLVPTTPTVGKQKLQPALAAP